MCLRVRDKDASFVFSPTVSIYSCNYRLLERDYREYGLLCCALCVCLVCNALSNHLNSHTRTSHSNSDALPILPTPSNFSGFMLSFYLIP